MPGTATTTSWTKPPIAAWWLSYSALSRLHSEAVPTGRLHAQQQHSLGLLSKPLFRHTIKPATLAACGTLHLASMTVSHLGPQAPIYAAAYLHGSLLGPLKLSPLSTAYQPKLYNPWIREPPQQLSQLRADQILSRHFATLHITQFCMGRSAIQPRLALPGPSCTARPTATLGRARHRWTRAFPMAPPHLVLRFGEALHPGPTLRIGTTNPSGANGKSQYIADLPPGIWDLSETHLTTDSIKSFDKQLKFHTRAAHRRIRTSYGAPAPLRTGSQSAGTWTGVLQFADLPTQAIHVPNLATFHHQGRLHISRFWTNYTQITGVALWLADLANVARSSRSHREHAPSHHTRSHSRHSRTTIRSRRLQPQQISAIHSKLAPSRMDRDPNPAPYDIRLRTTEHIPWRFQARSSLSLA